MKRFIALLLSVLMLLSLCACGGPENGNNPSASYDEGEDSESNEVEEREPGVPEGQIRADLETMAKDDDMLKSAVKDGEVDSIRIEHSYDEDSHIDTCVANVYFSCWYGILEYSIPCTYQYSKDSDLWSLIGSEDGEVGEIEYDTNALKSCEGSVFNVDYSNLAVEDTIYSTNCPSGMTVEKVSVVNGEVKMTLNFDFEAPEGLGHVSHRVTLPCQNRYALMAGQDYSQLYGCYLIISSTVTSGGSEYHITVSMHSPTYAAYVGYQVQS